MATVAPILHHYPASLFSEKVRLAFGMRQITWRSVLISEVMPRPELMPLTGGYRRTPVLQIGADIYCDTQCILPALDRLDASGSPLFPYAGLEWPIQRWADTAFFQAAVGVVFGGLPEGTLSEDFIADREQLSGRPFDLEAMRRASPHALAQWHGGLRWIESRLDSDPSDTGQWLLGAAPSAADLAVYMVLWFATRNTASERLRLHESTRRWMARVEAFGHGEFEEISASRALEEATRCEPEEPADVATLAVTSPGLSIGDEVVVTPEDYGRVPVAGVLLRADDEMISVLREDEQAGRIAVHFPRVGFQLNAKWELDG